MRNLKSFLGLAALALLLASPAKADSSAERRVAEAADVLDQLLRIPEKQIPPTLLSRAYAVAVIPDVVKAGFVFGARRGKGIIVIRQDDQTWSNPAFVNLTGGSIGWQAGVESADVILVFKSRKGVSDIADGKLTLGGDISIAAGPIGRHAEIATDIEFETEVFSYSRSRGLFAGVSLEGSGITMDKKSNKAFYAAKMTPDQIFASSPNIAPDIANTFVQILTAQTRRLPTSPGMQTSTTGQTPAVEEPQESEVRTFGMPSGNN